MSYQMQTKPSVGFLEAGRLYFQNATNSSGRARRSEYWMAILFLLVVNLVGGFVLGLLIGLLGDVGAILGSIISIVWGLVCVVASLTLCIRRLHDTGRSGWWYLLGLIPFGSIVLLVFFCMDSTEDNKWGPNPKLIRAEQNSYEPWNGYAAQNVNREPEYLPQPPRREAAAPVYESTVYEQDTIVTAGAVPSTAAVPTAYCTLYLYAGPMAGQTFRFPEGRTVILGRSGRCDVVLGAYNVVSGTHCKISIGKNYVTVTDLGSTNGTFVGGKRLVPNQPVPVKNGSTFQLANPTCAFQVRFE